MNWFLAHIAFTLLWAALLGAYDPATLLSGFIIGFFLLRLTLKGPSNTYRARLCSVGRFSFFYIGEILKSNLRIALDLLRGKPAIEPGIVAVDASGLTQRSAVLVANLITMTPGTLSLDISEDGRLIYVHCLYCQDPETTRRAMEKDYVAAVLAFQKPF